jgi:phenylacetate-CoA ligase
VHSEDVLRVFVELKRDCDAHAAMADLANVIRGAFELTPEIVPIALGTLAREFEASIKAPRMVDRRVS